MVCDAAEAAGAVNEANAAHKRQAARVRAGFMGKSPIGEIQDLRFTGRLLLMLKALGAVFADYFIVRPKNSDSFATS